MRSRCWLQCCVGLFVAGLLAIELVDSPLRAQQPQPGAAPAPAADGAPAVPGAPTGVPGASGLKDALDRSARTGRPLLAMAGSKTCGPCQELLKRLSTDASLAPYLAAYIPLKIDTETPEWQTFAQRYKAPGNSIPILFVIRADGEQIYGQSGSHPGAQLPTVLGQALTQCGTILSDQQVLQAEGIVTKVNKLLSEERTDEAVAALVPALGAYGGSYAMAAQQVVKLGEELTSRGQKALGDAEQKLAIDDAALEGAIELVAINRTFVRLPEMNVALRDAMRKYRKEDTTKELLRQAEQFDKATQYAHKKQPKKAMSAYQAIAAKYEGTPAATLAETKIAELEGQGIERGAAPASGSSPAARTASRRKPAASEHSAEDLRKAQSYLRNAKTFAAKKNTTKAREYLEKVVSLVPGSDESQEAEKLLGELK
ncbi:MAG: thioredoxin family protein [Pirellulales bacterium]|nr:thioredoxin family protein [Pirellulales bacterium]